MVAASKAHFLRNPFVPSRIPSRPKGHLRPLGAFVDRGQRADEDAYLPQENRYYKMISDKMEVGQSTDNIYQLRRSYVREKKSGLCPTLTANMGVGGHNVPFIRDDWGIRRMSVSEVAKLQGFETSEPLFPADVPEAERYRLVGNAACVHLTALVGAECLRILRPADGTQWQAA